MKHAVLIVEDEKIVREGLARALSREYKTFQASNGSEAMDILSSNNNIKVVVSDLKMPEVDGFELLEHIQAEKKKIHVIFVTAFYTIESAVDAIKQGAFDYLTKPVDLEKLQDAINRAINVRENKAAHKKTKEGAQ